MKVIRDIKEWDKKQSGCVLSIGNFDGVHVGHRLILDRAKKEANRRQKRLVAMTFEPHPVAVLHPEKNPGVLTPLEMKEYYLSDCGVDVLVVLPGDRELLSLSPEEFVEEFLTRNIRPGVVFEGEDFNFGSGRSGGLDILGRLGKEKGFEVRIIDEKEITLSSGESVRASSSLIRNLLEAGRVSEAAGVLGRPYRLIGRVIKGHGKGRQLGFPTANLEGSNQVIPGEGVYAGFVHFGEKIDELCGRGEARFAAFSIGRAQTFGEYNSRLIEAHLLEENVPDLIGSKMAMEFIQRLRAQKRFASEKELLAQIEKDCKRAGRILRDSGT